MRHPSGKVSFGGLLLLALLVGGVYLGVTFIPFYVDNMDVKEAVAAAHNRAAQGAPDSTLRNTIIERTSQMGSHWEVDQFDNDVLKPGLGLTDEQILIERSGVTGSVRIEVNYERQVRLKPTDHVHTLRFHVVKDGIPGQ
ncbi:hypothetical protein F0U60_24865 [Archangium minus]|uniref:DUF4845 domain-containing protein n=1 Tax=Archangium minus TaxID=83450 RepID=A0ABY9WTL4_9BACT|nr:hypothetical protein F0U61_24985 [Archangium violaceum]WNG47000.1 hypothetical protein F0U60_24865 [Archangium minus]